MASQDTHFHRNQENIHKHTPTPTHKHELIEFLNRNYHCKRKIRITHNKALNLLI